MPARKRKVFIPPKKTAAAAADRASALRRPASRSTRRRSTGAPASSPGDKVRILGTGLYAGELAVIEKMAGGVVPAAVVRTEAGRSRTVRTVDLEPVG